MQNKPILLFIFAILYSTASFANLVRIPTAQQYKSGKDLCLENQSIIKRENGFFTEAYINPANPSAGQFDLYAWFQGEYKPERPTVVYLTGGPGQTSHWGQSALSGDYNVLMFDVRGVGCSRPRTYEQYLTPSFYSSENVAADLEVLRKSLNIQKWSLYGVSYGTIPATIYASKFASHTTSVVLEGVAYDPESLWIQNHRRRLILEAIALRSPEIINLIKNIETNGVESAWFFNWSRDQLMPNNGYGFYKETLAGFSNSDTFARFIKMLQEQYGPQPEYPRNELFLLNEVPYFMIVCQELAIADYPTELVWNWAGDAIDSVNKEIIQSCQLLNARTTKEYSAVNYPILAPVFYFQGQNDPATEAHGAQKHFDKVAQGTKQMFLLENGGHNPNLQILKEEVEGQHEVTLNAILGKKSDASLIERINLKLESLRWIIGE